MNGVFMAMRIFDIETKYAYEWIEDFIRMNINVGISGKLVTD